MSPGLGLPIVGGHFQFRQKQAGAGFEKRYRPLFLAPISVKDSAGTGGQRSKTARKNARQKDNASTITRALREIGNGSLKS
jgi:hypothetical protein